MTKLKVTYISELKNSELYFYFNDEADLIVKATDVTIEFLTGNYVEKKHKNLVSKLLNRYKNKELLEKYE